MLSQEFREELDNYILLHYRPEGAKERHFNYDEKPPVPAGMALGVVAWLIDSDLYKRFAKLGATFSEKLMWWIKKQGRNPVEVYRTIDISKEHFAKIRNNPQYHPTKGTALAFAIALHLNMEDTQDLLKRAGYALTDSSKSDVIVMCFLEKGIYKIDEINAALYSYDCKPLTNWRGNK
ncbi:hypothetical protein [Selenomonas ruminantium]|uniref:hypothetical protein n=1 Tax=Selenomonas ruminantium TaxID=971 RepID=UPI00041A6CA6|nr:hypothetical protein [Selenomonas ruminantium]